MGSFSAFHWIIVALVILVLFGRGKISETMGDFGRGIKSFKKGMEDEDTRRDALPPQQVTDQTAVPAQPAAAPSAPATAELQPQAQDQSRP